MIVLDTNIVLDLFVFDDAAVEPLRTALTRGKMRWLATQAMRDELARVLGYPKIMVRLGYYEKSSEHVLRQFDAGVTLVEVAAKASVTCKDPDDQKFIDLAVAHQALLLSKDSAVLCMSRRLLALGASVRTAL